MSYSTLTCIVNTPSSWEDSFFIWSARTCASSRMENSLSAPQYPQERAEHSRTKLQEKANKPRWNRVSLTRKAARLLGVKSRGFSPVRLAMMAVRLQAGETRSLNWRRKEKLQGELLLQLCSVKYASPFSPAQVSTISSSKKQCNSLKSLSREENRSMRQRRVVVCFFSSNFKVVGVPSSVSRSNSWKSGKVCVSRRFTTMGVKVGGGETQQSYRRLDLRINGSGFLRCLQLPLGKGALAKRGPREEWIRQIAYDKQSVYVSNRPV